MFLQRILMAIVLIGLSSSLLAQRSSGLPAKPLPAQPVTPLTLGQSLERKPIVGQKDVFTLAAQKGQYFEVVAEQKGADVAVEVIAPSGRSVVTVDSPNGDWGPEPACILVAESGQFQVVVSTSTLEPQGAYAIRWKTLRAASPHDSDRIQLQDAMAKATVLFVQSKNAESLEVYLQADALAGTLGAKYQGGLARHMEGSLLLALGQPEKALEYDNQALSIRREIGDHSGESSTLSNIGLAYDDIGQPEKALEYYNQALPIEREVGDRQGEETTLNNIGSVYLSIGQPQKALEFLNQALLIEREVGARDGEASTLNNIGGAYHEIGQPQKALEYYNRALPINRELDDRDGEATTLSNIGLVYSNIGQPQKALQFFVQARLIEREVGDRSGEAYTLGRMGDVYSNVGHAEEALPDYLDALQIARAVNDLELQGQTNASLMSFYAGKNPSLALFFGRAAVNHYQQIRSNMQGLSKELQAGFAQSKTPVYRKLAELLIQQGRLREAEDVLDLLKEQELKDAAPGVSKSKDDAGTLPLSNADRKAEADIATQAGAASALLTLEDQAEALQAKTSRTPEEQAQLSDLNAKIATDSTAIQQFFYVTLPRELGNPASADLPVNDEGKNSSIRAELKNLPAGTVAVYTLAMKDHTYLLVTTPFGVTKYEAKLAGKPLHDALVAARDALRDPSSNPKKSLQGLYSAILAPILPALKAAKAHTILWSLDGALQYLPLNSLYDGKHYMVEKYANVVITPASRNHMLDAPKPAGWQMAAMGISRSYLGSQPLPGVDAELDAIVRDTKAPASHGVLPGRLLENNGFTLAAFEGISNKFQVVHVASHFIYHSGNGDTSYLLLAGDTTGGPGYKLSMAEMRNTLEFTGVQLLTLSACSTAVGGDLPNGGEVDSLAMIVQKNDAAAVISTLWDVNDASTSILMSDFYARWLGGKPMTKVAALREAQMALLHGSTAAAGATSAGGAPPFAHPYYWAPFVLIGNFQ
jgi:CHAT domain-containing protein